MFFVVKLVDLLKFSLMIIYEKTDQKLIQMKTGLNDQVLHFWLERQWQHMDHPIELHSNDCA